MKAAPLQLLQTMFRKVSVTLDERHASTAPMSSISRRSAWSLCRKAPNNSRLRKISPR